MRALAKDPDQRYGSAEEMDADLARVARGVAVSPKTEDAMTQVLAGAGLAAAQTMVTRPRAVTPPPAPPELPRARPVLRYEEPPRRPLDLAVAARARPDRRRADRAAGSSTRRSSSSSTRTSRSPCPTSACCPRDLTTEDPAGGPQPARREGAERHRAGGTGLRQNPGGGSKVAQGSTVTLRVSTGKPQVTVPDVADAMSRCGPALAQSGCNRRSSRLLAAARDTVTRQFPPPGDKVPKGRACASTSRAARSRSRCPT